MLVINQRLLNDWFAVLFFSCNLCISWKQTFAMVLWFCNDNLKQPNLNMVRLGLLDYLSKHNFYWVTRNSLAIPKCCPVCGNYCEYVMHNSLWFRNSVLCWCFTGILQERFVEPMLAPSYYARLSKETKEEWLNTYGKNVNESIQEFLVEYIGKPLEKFLRWIETKNNCVCTG